MSCATTSGSGVRVSRHLTGGEAPARGVRQELQQWRDRTLSGVALVTAPCFAAVALWYFFVENPVPEIFAVLMSGAVVLLAVTLLRSLPFTLRVSLTLGTFYLAAGVANLRLGYGPNPSLVLGTVCFLGTLLLGWRSGIAIAIACTLTLAAIGYAHATHLVQRAPGWERVLDGAIPANIVRVVLTFALLTTVLVTATWYVLSRSEELALAKERSLEDLRREQAERERISRDLELREAAFHKARELELLGRLAGSMAHDFNNALLVIWAALDELALLSSLPEAAQVSLSDLRSAADQAFATTKQLRAFGPMAPRRESEVALTPLLDKTKTMFSRILPQNIALETELELDAFILADEGEVLRVLMNLALNGRDAMRDGGKLIIRVRRPTERELVPAPSANGPGPDAASPQRWVVIEVEDNGSGMTEEVKNRIFEPFFTTKQAAGAGLGLASVRDLLRSHGGRVEVKSEVGSGTTISLLWPAIERPGEHRIEPTAAHDDRPLVVLLVDDDASVRLALRRNLMRAGITVLDAGDGAQALTIARRHQAPIHLLCTDCVMPGPSARQLIAQFRELHGGRVLVCSGYAPAETGLTPEIFDDFLAKPFSGETLVARVRALVAAR